MKKSFILFFLMMFALSTVAFATNNGKVKINYAKKKQRLHKHDCLGMGRGKRAY